MRIETRANENDYDTETDREKFIVGAATGCAMWIGADGYQWSISAPLTKEILKLEKERHNSVIRAGELVIEKNDLYDKLRVAEGKVVALTQAASMRPTAQIIEAKESVPPIDPMKFVELLTKSVERIAAAVRGPLTPGTPGP